MIDDQKPAGPVDAPHKPAQEATLARQTASLERLVAETMKSLAERGIDAYELAPLMKLKDAIRALDSSVGNERATETIAAAIGAHPAPLEQPTHYDKDGRRADLKASEDVMARASAIIDLLVQAGQTPEHAAQIITRQLLAVGIELPETGGDARAWKRLHNWRNSLIHYKRKGSAWDIYCAFKEELGHIPPDQRLRRAVGERLWDRRREYMSAQESA